MTREDAKELPPITQAFVEGKTIQDWINDTWKYKEYTLFGELSQSPIKPKPKYRPFKNQEECWQEIMKHQPFGWVKNKTTNNLYNLLHISKDKVVIGIASGDFVLTLSDLFEY